MRKEKKKQQENLWDLGLELFKFTKCKFLGKTDKFGFIKVRKFCSVKKKKKPVKKMKRQPSKWEKIFVNCETTSN